MASLRKSNTRSFNRAAHKKTNSRTISNTESDSDELQALLPCKWSEAPFTKTDLLKQLKTSFGEAFVPSNVKAHTNNTTSVDGIIFHVRKEMSNKVNDALQKGIPFQGLMITGGFLNSRKRFKINNSLLNELIKILTTPSCYHDNEKMLSLRNFNDICENYYKANPKSFKVIVDFNDDRFINHLNLAISKRKELSEIPTVILEANMIYNLSWLNKDNSPFKKLIALSLNNTMICQWHELISLAKGNVHLQHLQFSNSASIPMYPIIENSNVIASFIKTIFPNLITFNSVSLTNSAPAPKELMRNIETHSRFVKRVEPLTFMRSKMTSVGDLKDFVCNFISSLGHDHALYAVGRSINVVNNASMKLNLANPSVFPISWQNCASAGELSGFSFPYAFSVLDPIKKMNGMRIFSTESTVTGVSNEFMVTGAGSCDIGVKGSLHVGFMFSMILIPQGSKGPNDIVEPHNLMVVQRFDFSLSDDHKVILNYILDKNADTLNVNEYVNHTRLLDAVAAMIDKNKNFFMKI